MLGVELEEEFKLEKHVETYKFTENGMMYSLDRKNWGLATFTLADLLRGKYEPKKLPWKPKQNGFYYYVRWYMEQNGKWRIEAKEEQYSRLCANDNMRVDVCNCFKTREEAEAQKYEVYKRLTGKDWSEYMDEPVDVEEHPKDRSDEEAFKERIEALKEGLRRYHETLKQNGWTDEWRG